MDIAKLIEQQILKEEVAKRQKATYDKIENDIEDICGKSRLNTNFNYNIDCQYHNIMSLALDIETNNVALASIKYPKNNQDLVEEGVCEKWQLEDEMFVYSNGDKLKKIMSPNESYYKILKQIASLNSLVEVLKVNLPTLELQEVKELTFEELIQKNI